MKNNLICPFCGEPLTKKQHFKTTIFSHVENGCEFVTFEYNGVENLADLVDYLTDGDYLIKRN